MSVFSAGMISALRSLRVLASHRCPTLNEGCSESVMARLAHGLQVVWAVAPAVHAFENVVHSRGLPQTSVELSLTLPVVVAAIAGQRGLLDARPFPTPAVVRPHATPSASS